MDGINSDKRRGGYQKREKGQDQIPLHCETRSEESFNLLEAVQKILVKGDNDDDRNTDEIEDAVW